MPVLPERRKPLRQGAWPQSLLASCAKNLSQLMCARSEPSGRLQAKPAFPLQDERPGSYRRAQRAIMRTKSQGPDRGGNDPDETQETSSAEADEARRQPAATRPPMTGESFPAPGQ